jgi:hypothetical protein
MTKSEDRQTFDPLAAAGSVAEVDAPTSAGGTPRLDRRPLVRLRRENNGRRSFALPALVAILLLGAIVGAPWILTSYQGGGGAASAPSRSSYNLRFVLMPEPRPSGNVIAGMPDTRHWSVRLTRRDGTQIGRWDIYRDPPLAVEVPPGSYQISVSATVWVDDVDNGSRMTGPPVSECQADVTVASGPTITATITTTRATCSIAVA